MVDTKKGGAKSVAKAPAALKSVAASVKHHAKAAKPEAEVVVAKAPSPRLWLRRSRVGPCLWLRRNPLSRPRPWLRRNLLSRPRPWLRRNPLSRHACGCGETCCRACVCAGDRRGEGPADRHTAGSSARRGNRIRRRPKAAALRQAMGEAVTASAQVPSPSTTRSSRLCRPRAMRRSISGGTPCRPRICRTFCVSRATAPARPTRRPRRSGKTSPRQQRIGSPRPSSP